MNTIALIALLLSACGSAPARPTTRQLMREYRVEDSHCDAIRTNKWSAHCERAERLSEVLARRGECLLDNVFVKCEPDRRH